MCTCDGKRRLACGVVGGCEESGDPWNGARAIDAQDSGVTRAEDFWLVVAECGPLSQQQRRRCRADLLDGPDNLCPDSLVLIADKIDEVSKQISLGEGATLDEGQSAASAHSAG